METGDLDVVMGERQRASRFALQLSRFAGLLQLVAATADNRSEPHEEIGMDFVQELPTVETAAEFLLLRSILAEFAARTLAACGVRGDAVLELIQAAPGSDLAALFTKCLGSAVGPASGPAEMGELRAQGASSLIAERCCEPGLEAKQIAQAVGISPEYLRKLLQAWYGYGFRGARRRARMRVAVKELENSFARIKEISNKLGYSSTSQLDRDFKTQHGISPGEYRRRILSSRRVERPPHHDIAW